MTRAVSGISRRRALTVGTGTVVLGAAVLASGPSAAHAHGDPRRRRPLVIGHRGASGYRPEHVDGLFTDNPDVGVLARELA